MDLTDKKELEWSAPPKQWVPQKSGIDADSLSRVLLGGDLRQLTPEQKIQYYSKVCELLHLNPLTQPFQYIVMQGKEILYASKGCAEQLRSIHRIGIKVKDAKKDGDLYIVTVEAVDPTGRTDTGMGVISIKGLSGLDLSNAMMKCETKAKRRATLSICGLNMWAECEINDIPPRITPDQPMFGDGMQPDGLVVRNFAGSLSRWNGKAITQMDPAVLKEMVLAIESKAARLEKAIPAWAQEFIEHASPIIGDWENLPIG